MIIGITGKNASGKDEVASILVKLGYKYFSLSDIIRQSLKNKNIEILRKNLIKEGTYLRKNYGLDYLADKTVENIKTNNIKNSVIVSIRNINEVTRLKKEKDFILLAIKVDDKIIFERELERNRENPPENFEEFIKLEKIEFEGNPAGQQLLKCIEMANFTINNDNSKELLKENLLNFLKKKTN